MKRVEEELNVKMNDWRCMETYRGIESDKEIESKMERGWEMETAGEHERTATGRDERKSEG